MLRSPLFRALALVLALSPLLAACDAVGDEPPASTFTAAERAALMQYLPEPIGRRSQPGVDETLTAHAREVQRKEPCEDCQPPRDYALRFGPGRSVFASTFSVIQDQTFRVAMDVRPDHVDETQHLLASNAGLRFSILPDGAVRFQTPGYVDGEEDIWTLTTRPYAVRTGRWQRVEVTYNELLLRIAVDGQVKASTVVYEESSPRPVGPVTFAPSFSGSIDRPRFSTYDGGEVFESASFDEGSGVFARFTGTHGANHRLTRASWVVRGFGIDPEV